MSTTHARAPRSRRRLLPLTVFTAAALALLAFAGSAFAETKVGEYSAPLDPTVPAEASILHISTEYQAATGALTFAVTTAAAPQPEVNGEENPIELIAGLVTLPQCTVAELEKAGENGLGYPVFEMMAPYGQPGFAEWAAIESEKEGPKVGLAGKELEGTKTILSAQSPKAVNKPYTCGIASLIGVENEAGEEAPEAAVFPLTVKSEPPPVTPPSSPTPEATPAPATPAPAALSIAKTKKPLKLKVGKWATVKVQVTNSGGTATGLGALRVKAPAGFIVKPERQKVPVLTPGQSWTLSVRVQATAKAKKKKATIALTATAPGIAAGTGSLAVKLLGG